MADVLNKTSKQYLSSVNTPDYLDGNWLINPDMSVVAGLPTKYWVIENDTLRAATTQERALVDELDGFEHLTIPQVKAVLNTKVNVFRDTYIDTGVLFQGFSFDSDARARENISGMCNALALGVPIPETFTWRSKNNEDIPMDASALGQFGIGILTFVSACFSASWAHKDYINSMDTENIHDLLNYNYMINWPTNVLENLVLQRPN